MKKRGFINNIIDGKIFILDVTDDEQNIFIAYEEDKFKKIGFENSELIQNDFVYFTLDQYYDIVSIELIKRKTAFDYVKEFFNGVFYNTKFKILKK